MHSAGQTSPHACGCTKSISRVHRPGKGQRLLALGYGIPDWLRFVPVNFEAGASRWAALTTAGFDAGRPDILASTGVSTYVSRDATLRQIAQLAPGSMLAMIFLLKPELLDAADRAGYAATQQGARTSGTPFISHYAPDEMLALALEAGLP